jgi:2-oxoglutarate ferredoxin oxidoreductase subunit alpha
LSDFITRITPEMHKEYLKKLSGKTLFIQGDAACAYGALYAGCTFFGGYPITPASEIAELLAIELPKVGGYSIQMEDEIASIGAVIGAVWAGAKAMTATSGPGFSLMQENIGYAIMTETPCVLVDIQRSGPSTGQATKAAQGDVMQARWGTHGDHNIIALSPSSVQEYLTLTIDCFNLAEEYRTPVVLLADGELGHIREKIVMPDPDDIELIPRRFGKKDEPLFGGDTVPPMTEFGQGLFAHVTGSTHKEDGMRDVQSQDVHEKLVTRVYKKISDSRNKITMIEKDYQRGAETTVVSYGVTARPAKGAVLKARAEGKKINYLRLISIWPFPQKVIRDLGKRNSKIYVPEMNLGQVSREIERFVDCEVIQIPKIGGIPHTINDIYSRLN